MGSSKLLSANERVNQIDQQQSGAKSASAVNNGQADHGCPFVGWSSRSKPITSRAVVPHSKAMPPTNTISMYFLLSN